MYKDCCRKEKAIKDLDGRIAGGLFIGSPIFGQWSSRDMGAKLRSGPVLSLFCKMDSEWLNEPVICISSGKEISTKVSLGGSLRCRIYRGGFLGCPGPAPASAFSWSHLPPAFLSMWISTGGIFFIPISGNMPISWSFYFPLLACMPHSVICSVLCSFFLM